MDTESPILRENEVLLVGPNKYRVKKLIDSGHFGDVFKCWNSTTKQKVAIKIIKSDSYEFDQTFKREKLILSRLNFEAADNFNMVRFLDSFSYNNRRCLVFEFLDQNLHNFIEQVQRLELNDIRKILQQVLVALQKLKEMGITHADLKPQNIMLVDHLNEPFRIKVIDFGNAMHTKYMGSYMYQQTMYYRAPEVILGLPVDEAIDMWSLGCIAAELFLGAILYCGNTEYDQLRIITATQSLPTTSMLNEGERTYQFFNRIDKYPYWILKTPEEYEEENVIEPMLYQTYDFANLDDIANIHLPLQSTNEELYFKEKAERTKFVGLLKHMLNLSPKYRIKPAEALNHPFLSNKMVVNHSQDNMTIRDVFLFIISGILECLSYFDCF